MSMPKIPDRKIPDRLRRTGILLVLLVGCSQPASNTSSAQTPQRSTSTPTAIYPRIDLSPIDLLPTKPVPESQADAIDHLAERALNFAVNVKLVDGSIELSESALGAGHIEFNILNEAAEPLAFQVIKTELPPEKVLVKAGQVDRTQPGVEVLSSSSYRPITPGKQATIVETLAPGKYKIMVTSAQQTQPVAYTVMILLTVV